MEKIAVFLPVHNEEKYIQKTIDSILQQDYENFDLVISENHSTDATLEWVFEANRLDTRIKVIRPPEKLNSFGNLNFAVRYVNQGGYWASMMLGGHDLISKNVLSSYVRCLNTYPNAMMACQTKTFEIDEQDNVTRQWPPFHQSGHMNGAFDALLTLLSLMYNTPIFGLWRQSLREKVSFRHPCVGGDHLYVAEAVSQGAIQMCDDAEVYLRRSPISDSYLKKHFAEASGDAAAAADMAVQLNWLCDIVDNSTIGYPEYARALHKVSAISLYLVRYNHHFQTFGADINSLLEHPALAEFVRKQMDVSTHIQEQLK